MYRCDICGYSADEELSLCPQCGCEEAEAESSSATELEESDEQRISEDDEQEYADMVERRTNLFEYVSCGVPDVVDTSEVKAPLQRSGIGKQGKAIALCVGVLALSFISVFLLGRMMSPRSTDGGTSSATQQKETAKTTETQRIEMKPTQYSMTDDFSDYQVMIDGIVYQMHMTVGEILDSGWILAGDVTDGVLPAGERAEIVLKSANGATMQITAVNFSSTNTACRDCIVCEIKVEQEGNSQAIVNIFEGLTLGSAHIDEVKTAIGWNGEEVSAGRGYVLTYTESETKIAQFTFDKETEQLIGIRFCDNKKPSGYDDGDLENADQIALPYPTDPEVTPTSGIISIDGEVYRLPISIDVMISRGWTAELETDSKRIPAGGRAYATFTRGKAVLTGVDVYNPTISEGYISDCVIVSVSSSSAEGWVVFPLGIKAGISEAAFILSVEGMEYEFDDTYFDEYVFLSDEYTFVVDIDSKTGKVIYVSSSYNY